MLSHHHQQHPKPTTFSFHVSNCIFSFPTRNSRVESINKLNCTCTCANFIIIIPKSLDWMGGEQKKLSHRHRERNEIMGVTVSHKPSGLDLMQNCDLPPPSKVFMGPDKTVMLSMNRVCNIAGKEEEYSKYHGTYGNENDDDSDKMKLLKALQASQTRAREAEKKAAVLSKEREGLSNALLVEAMQLFAYRQHVRLLELQVSNLQSLWLPQQPATSRCCARPPEGAVGSSKEDGRGEERSSVTWVLALALSLGIGVTTALACRYLL